MRIALLPRVDGDYLRWCDAQREGKAAFVDRTVRVGARIGVVLALWNGAVGGTTGTYHATPLIFESVYFLSGAVGLARLQAEWDWRSLRRRFARALSPRKVF